MRNVIVALLPLLAISVSCVSGPERRVTVGMPLPQSLNALTTSNAHETLLDVVPPAAGRELRCFELHDRRLVCLVTDGQVVIGIGVCENPGEQKGQRVWTEVEELAL
jgi:hypothetical protein